MKFRQIFSKIIFNENNLSDFVVTRSLICNCLLLKDISFYAKCFVGLTSSRIFGSGNFEDKSPLWFLKNLKFFKNALGQFLPNCPVKDVITGKILPSTAVVMRWLRLWYNSSNIRYIFRNKFFYKHFFIASNVKK